MSDTCILLTDKFTRGIDERRLASKERLIVIQGAGTEPGVPRRQAQPVDQDFRQLQQQAQAYSSDQYTNMTQTSPHHESSRAEHRARFENRNAFSSASKSGAASVSQSGGPYRPTPYPALHDGMYQLPRDQTETFRDESQAAPDRTPTRGRERPSSSRSTRTQLPENTRNLPQRPKTPESQLDVSSASRPRTPNNTPNPLATASGLLRDANGVLAYPGSTPTPVEFGTPELHRRQPIPTKPTPPRSKKGRQQGKPPPFLLEDIHSSPPGMPQGPQGASPPSLGQQVLVEAPLNTQSIGDIPQHGGGVVRPVSARRQREGGRNANQNVWAQDSDGNWYDASKGKAVDSRCLGLFQCKDHLAGYSEYH